MKINPTDLEKLKKQFCIDFNYDPMFRMISFYDKALVTAEKQFYDWAVAQYGNCFSGWVFSMKNV